MHIFQPNKRGSNVCKTCGQLRGTCELTQTAELPGMIGSDSAREAARGIAEAERLTEILHSKKADVSDRAGKMERKSPLFFGTGENPTLF